MINEIAPILILLAVALLILGGARLARLAKLPEAVGSGAVLWLVAIGVGFFVANGWAWEPGRAGGDRLLTYARLVGLTGMMFLAGESFRAEKLRERTTLWFGLFGVSLLVAVTLLLKFFGNQETGPATLIAATLVSSTLWWPAQFRHFNRENEGDHPVDWFAVAVVLSTLGMLAVYFVDVLGVIERARPSASAYVIVTLFELVKLIVLFAFAYFISTRFLDRARGRISVIRTTIGFVLISILLFALAALATGQLGAIACAFIAGALWRRTKVGRVFSESPKPLASAMLLSFVFVSVLLQSHGRQLSRSAVVLVTIVTAIALKVVFSWLVLRTGRIAKTQRARLAVATALPGEMAILFLGFGMTRWAIDAPVYFGILGYALLTSLLVPVMWHFATRERTIAVGATKGGSSVGNQSVRTSGNA